jgi:peroxiredoxin
MDARPPSVSTDHEPSNRKTLATLGLLALLAVPVFLLVALQRSAKSRVLRTGDSIPTAALRIVDPGEALLAGISGRRAAILFFSVDCPRCLRDIPIFNEAGKRFGEEVEFVAIALTDRQKTQTFVRTNNIGARVIIDDRGVVGRLFGVSEVPAVFLVNRDQRIEWVEVGEQSKAELLRRLSMLAGSGPSTAAQNAENTRR